jgi:hypothetical protein
MSTCPTTVMLVEPHLAAVPLLTDDLPLELEQFFFHTCLGF